MSTEKVEQLIVEFEAQIEIFNTEKVKATTNKSAAKRLRGAISEMTKIGKELRKATLELAKK